MEKMSKTVIPPVLVSICVVLQIISYFIDFPTLRVVLSILLVVGGFGIGFSSGRLLHSSGTTHKRDIKPTKLVTSGVYSYTRNPIYLGFVVILSGVSLLCNTSVSAILAVSFYVVIEKYYIPAEEKDCSEVFKASFDEYKVKTPKWI